MSQTSANTSMQLNDEYLLWAIQALNCQMVNLLSNGFPLASYHISFSCNPFILIV
jgi:hypothetical protein